MSNPTYTSDSITSAVVVRASAIAAMGLVLLVQPVKNIKGLLRVEMV